MYERFGLSLLGDYSSNLDTGGAKELIFEPTLSRPFNPAVGTVDPDLVRLVEQIWYKYFAGKEEQKTSGRKPTRPYIDQLRVLITDLFLAWQEDENLCLGVPFSEGAWNSKSRYNPHGLSKYLVKIIHHLQDVGLVRVSAHSFAGVGAPGNRNSRIQAAWKLQQQFRQIWIKPQAIFEVPRECIILKAGEGLDSKEIEYEDTEETLAMRDNLQAYNDLLSRTFIDIPTQQDPWITRFDEAGQEHRVGINPRNQFVRRIFSRGSWTLNGRFYGPWWQNLSGKQRSQIFINDTPTVEIDFKAMHIQILAAREGVEVVGDPYTLPPGQFEGVDQSEQRDLVKLLVLTALNAKTMKATCAAFRSGLEAGHPCKHLKNKDIESVLNCLTDQTPWLGKYLGQDQGIGLMFTDSQIMDLIINRCTRAGLPVLGIHDSVIVPYTHSLVLEGIMNWAAREVLGKKIPLDMKQQGLPDQRGKPLEEQLNFETWRETERCPEYLGRLRLWEEAAGKEVIPYRMN